MGVIENKHIKCHSYSNLQENSLGNTDKQWLPLEIHYLHETNYDLLRERRLIETHENMGHWGSKNDFKKGGSLRIYKLLKRGSLGYFKKTSKKDGSLGYMPVQKWGSFPRHMMRIDNGKKEISNDFNIHIVHVKIKVGRFKSAHFNLFFWPYLSIYLS